MKRHLKVFQGSKFKIQMFFMVRFLLTWNPSEVFFFIETTLRLIVHRLFFFVNDNAGWNLDLGIVTKWGMIRILSELLIFIDL